MEGHSDSLLLRMLVIITDKPVEKKVVKILDDFRVKVRYQFRGKGTASSEFLEICGLSESGRIITAGLVLKSSVHGVFEALDEKLRIWERGRGIAFTVPVSGLQNYLLKQLEEEQLENESGDAKRKEEDMKEELKEEMSYVMVLVACNQGYSGEVMEAARGAGATGGTILKSRRQGLEEPVKFMEVSIQEEQEVISIVVPKNIKKEVMKEISEKCGCQTPARGIILSLPVDEIIGLS